MIKYGRYLRLRPKTLFFFEYPGNNSPCWNEMYDERMKYPPCFHSILVTVDNDNDNADDSDNVETFTSPFRLHSRTVSLHLSLVTFFVLGGLILPNLAFAVLESLVLGRDNASNVTEGSLGIFFLDSWTDVNREQEVGTHVPFRGVRVFLRLLFLPPPVGSSMGT